MKNDHKVMTVISFAVGLVPPCIFLFYALSPAYAAAGFLLVLISFLAAFRLYAGSAGSPARSFREVAIRDIKTLFNVKDQTEKMTLDMVDVMGRILKKTTEGADEASAVVDYFIGIPGKEKSSFGASYISQMIQRNEQVLGKAGSLFKDISRVNTDLLTRVQTSAKKIEGIYAFVSEINQLALHTRILALNAMVEAVRAGGEYAAGFAVVADEVRKMADRSQTIASSISTVAKESKDIMDSLQKEMQLRVAEGMAGMESVEKDLMVTFGTLKTGIDNISEAIEVVTLNYQAIEKDIKGVIVALQYQDITSQQLNSVISDFSTLVPDSQEIQDMIKREMPEKQRSKPVSAVMEKESATAKVRRPRDVKYKDKDNFEDDVTFF